MNQLKLASIRRRMNTMGERKKTNKIEREAKQAGEQRAWQPLLLAASFLPTSLFFLPREAQPLKLTATDAFMEYNGTLYILYNIQYIHRMMSL